MNIRAVKQRFGIIGNNEKFNRILEISLQVAPTDLSALIVGESGVGKEVIPKIIHAYSKRKHNKYVAVNCGAIPEGTMDSELFGHVKGSFTGAVNERKGYFEEANEGTIFLDEIAEMPLQTQAKFLRVLESGEFMKVGSSKLNKVNVRVIAASNINFMESIRKGKFREDLYYRLNTVPINILPLRERKEDIHLLFRKFASDIAEKYRMPPVQLTENAIELLKKYYWYGNIRQLKNITEQISVLEEKRMLNADALKTYLPNISMQNLPIIFDENTGNNLNEREILYKILFELRSEVNYLKKAVTDIINKSNITSTSENKEVMKELFRDPNENEQIKKFQKTLPINYRIDNTNEAEKNEEKTEKEESLLIEEKEKELIKKALNKNKGKKKYAAKDLGISERTLYRKLKDFDIN